MPLRISPRAAAAAAPACARAIRPNPAPVRLLRRTISQTTAAARTSPPIRSTRQLPPAPIRPRAVPFSVSTTAAFSSSSPSAPNPPAGDATTPPTKPDYLNEAETVIWDRLVAEFAPTELVVQDISGGCGSMYGIEISSDRFRGLGMLKQQRMVNSALADLMKGWHGVQLQTRAP